MYDEAEYGDTLKSWVVPTYMLCAIGIPMIVTGLRCLHYIITWRGNLIQGITGSHVLVSSTFLTIGVSPRQFIEGPMHFVSDFFFFTGYSTTTQMNKLNFRTCT